MMTLVRLVLFVFSAILFVGAIKVTSVGLLFASAVMLAGIGAWFVLA